MTNNTANINDSFDIVNNIFSYLFNHSLKEPGKSLYLLNK